MENETLKTLKIIISGDVKGINESKKKFGVDITGPQLDCMYKPMAQAILSLTNDFDFDISVVRDELTQYIITRNDHFTYKIELKPSKFAIHFWLFKVSLFFKVDDNRFYFSSAQSQNCKFALQQANEELKNQTHYFNLFVKDD